MRSKMLQPAVDLPVGARLMRELERDGVSGEFLRQYMLWRRELSVDDLKALWEAVIGRSQGAIPLALKRAT